MPAGANWVQGDIRDADFVESLWNVGDFDYVYHLAAYAAEGLSHFIRAYNYRTNLEASALLINQSVLHQVRRFVFTSSIAVYGAEQTPMSEDITPRPEDPYGISKYAVELDLAAAQDMFGLDFSVFRPHNVYGETEHLRSVPQRDRDLHESGAERPADAGLRRRVATRAFSHIDDVAPVISRAPLVDGTATRCSTWAQMGRTRSWSLREPVAGAFEVSLDAVHLPDRHEVVHALSTHEKARRVFGDNHRRAAGRHHRMADWVRA